MKVFKLGCLFSRTLKCLYLGCILWDAIYVVCAQYQKMNKVVKSLVFSSHWTALPIVDSSRTNFGSSRNWMKPFETKFWKYIYEIWKWSAEDPSKVYDLSLNIFHHKTRYLALRFHNTHYLKRYSGHKISQAEKKLKLSSPLKLAKSISTYLPKRSEKRPRWDFIIYWFEMPQSCTKLTFVNRPLWTCHFSHSSNFHFAKLLFLTILNDFLNLVNNWRMMQRAV